MKYNHCNVLLINIEDIYHTKRIQNTPNRIIFPEHKTRVMYTVIKSICRLTHITLTHGAYFPSNTKYRETNKSKLYVSGTYFQKITRSIIQTPDSV